MNLDSNGLEVLDRGECLTLMGSVPLGRLVFTDRALPAIQPVNFALDGEEVIIRTSSGSKLAAATRRAIVAFEVDSFDERTETGWSVTVIGQAVQITDPVRLQQVRRLPLQPWSPGDRDHYIGVSAEQITGRRIYSIRAHELPDPARAGSKKAAGAAETTGTGQNEDEDQGTGTGEKVA